jgi:hypothetical protein
MRWIPARRITDANGRGTDEQANPRVCGVARSTRDRDSPPRGDRRPGPVLGVLTEIPYLLPDRRTVLEVVSAFMTEALAFYLYVAYAERLTSEAPRSPSSEFAAGGLRRGQLVLSKP